MLRTALIASLTLVSAALIVSTIAQAEPPTMKRKTDGPGARLPAVQKVREPLRPRNEDGQKSKDDKGIAWVSGAGGTRGSSTAGSGKKSR